MKLYNDGNEQFILTSDDIISSGSNIGKKLTNIIDEHSHDDTHYCGYDADEDNACYQQASVVITYVCQLMSYHACQFFIVKQTQ